MCLQQSRCLDAYAGELALNRRYQELTNSENESYYTMRDFMKLSRNGDAVSQKILKDAAFYLGIDFEPDQDIGTQNGADCKL
ncbi:MAG: ROK family protein [Gallintestinimicrobium sp.]